ncbi:DUF551 domain-containing protein [Sphingobacterium mizutaii]|uniref:DUF551 domain-containing protein n=1 Tax=Sphingobacterium mizutaii TaxID=1010 RepID=UPI0028995479|nr:DUF551 domain-containing protein [Sphingobacterium mizutaii]
MEYTEEMSKAIRLAASISTFDQTVEKLSEEMLSKMYIDYGDLNLQAEEQLKEALITGMKEGWRIWNEHQAPKFKFLMEFYDKHVGTPCEEIRHKEEVDDLKARLHNWISVEELLPIEGGRYWCFCEEQGDLGLSGFEWNCAYNPDDKSFSDATLRQSGCVMRVTHWTNLLGKPQ